MKRKSELLKILIPAVGGQGGGVLTEWLVQAFMIEGFNVQGISLPGLSQRGGSTVYYIETHPKTNLDNRHIIFSQYPIPGDVDVILSQEFLELGRVLEQGYGSEKTTIVSSTHRIYSTPEKLPVSSGIYSEENIKRLAINFSSQFIGFNSLQLARENGMDELGINAILLGALAASEALPLSEASYLKAIEETGVAVKNNIKAFRIGWDYVKFKKYDSGKPDPQKRWEGFKQRRSEGLEPKKKEEYLRLISRAEIEYPTRLREILAEALFRLVDYQDVWYAEKYLHHLKSVYEIDQEMKGGYKLTELFAKNLALWMSYEDGIRVAELKIRPERFKRIKQEMRLRDDQVFQVIDYLKPDAYEIYGLLPNALVDPIIRLSESRILQRLLPKDKKITLEQKPVTTSFLGSLRLWLISKLKPVRHYSYRYHKEHSLIRKYKANVEKFAPINYDLGCLVAKSGEMIKGYGDVRRRTMNAFNRFLDNIITPLAEFEKKKNKNFDLTLEIGDKSLKLIAGATVDGIDNAEKMANDVLQGRAA
ncbi:MAG TPA: indolepyruvate oxidoreductase subunit beta family protein [Thermodesulfobacteriota bacterium]|nr:indolepyruvate oxidoreductase subunit beta family protein [Thermodesulfobacteriota bacterium]